METIAIITVIIIAMLVYHLYSIRKIQRDYADIVIERDDLRLRLAKAEKNDYRIKGRFAKRPQ